MSAEPVRRIHWKRPPPPADAKRRPGKLTVEEQACARVALKALAVRYGGWTKLAKRMGASANTLQGAAFKKRRNVGPGVALEVARVAGVTFDDVISGRWPARDSCPACGQLVHAGISERKA
jgi:hypothetical protein